MKELIQQMAVLSPVEQKKLMEDQNYSILDILPLIKSEEVAERDFATQIFMDLVNTRSVKMEELQKCIDLLMTYLYEGIGEQHSNTVFIRSTTTLWITILIQADMDQHFLAPEKANELLSKLSSYLMKEHDLRGYVEGRGWANAATNATNLYITCLQHPSFELRFIPNILSGITKSLITGYVFIDDEEARFAQLVQSLSVLDYPEEVIIEWIEQLYDKLQWILYEEGYTEKYYKMKTNLTHLMQSLYFKLKFSKTYSKTQGVIAIFLSKWVS